MNFVFNFLIAGIEWDYYYPISGISQIKFPIMLGYKYQDKIHWQLFNFLYFFV